MKRIHITGPPRSGTTLMMELLLTCFKINVYNKKEVSVLVVPPPTKPNTVVCSKNPDEWDVIPKLLRFDSEQRFIFMIRDPRDVVVSFHKRNPNLYWTNLRHWLTAWNAIKEFTRHDRLLLVHYEKLVKKPDEVQREILTRFPFLKTKLSFSQFHLFAKPSQESLLAMHGLRPLSGTSIGRWRNHKERLAGQLKLHGPITDLLIELGYETNDNWLMELQGVNEDTSPGFWPDHVSDKQKSLNKQRLDKSLEEYLKKRDLITNV